MKEWFMQVNWFNKNNQKYFEKVYKFYRLIEVVKI